MERKSVWVGTPEQLPSAYEPQADDLTNGYPTKPSKVDTVVCDPFVRQASAPLPVEFDEDQYEVAAFQRQASCPADELVYGQGDSSYPHVVRYIASLIHGFSMQNFQCDLQQLLMKARVAAKVPGHSRGIQKVVPGRCKLCEKVELNALAVSGLPNSEAGAWKMIARFVQDDNVVKQLSVIDELLALPPNSYYKAIIDCANN